MATEFCIGDAVQCHPGVYEHDYGVGLIIDKNPRYWFVQFTNGQLVALEGRMLNRIAGGEEDLGRPLFWGSR